MDDSKGTLANLLKTLRDQNKGNLLLQGLQVKYEKEIAGEDNDKREKQLDGVNENLKNIEKAIVGNKEQLKVIPKDIADKLSVKLSDIKVPEDDKTALESIKEFVGNTKSFFNKLSGGFGKGFDFVKNPMGAVKGGIEKVKELGTKAQDTFYDIAETKTGYTAEEGRFVEEYKKQNRKFASGMTREEVVSGKLQDQGTDAFRQIKDLEEKIKAAETDIQKSKKFGFQPTPEDQQKLEELKKLKNEVDVRQKQSEEKTKETVLKPGEEKLKEVEGKQSKNEEADNVVSAQEAMADSFKENTELLKELLTTTKDQLNIVNNIKEALAPKDVSDDEASLRKKADKFYDNVTVKLEEIYSKLDDLGSGKLSDTLLDLLSKKAPTSIPASATTAGTASAGSPLLAGAALGAVALGGAAATVGATGMLATESAAPLRKAVTQNSMLGAMSGDTALASGILDANEGKSAEQVRAIQEKEQKALKDAPWYTKMLGIGRSDYLRKQGVLPAATPVESVSGKIPETYQNEFEKKLGTGEYDKKLFSGLSKEQYQSAVGKEGGKYKVEMRDEKGDLITDEAKRIEYMRKGTKDFTQMQRDSFKNNPTPRVTPASARNTGADMSQATTENTELNREASRAKPSAPVIMNNSSSNNNTSYVPMKSTPRPEYTGSALDRYQSRISTY